MLLRTAAHMKKPSLSEGFLDGYTIECPRHGASFDVRSGKALCLPATRDLKHIPLVIREQTIFVKDDQIMTLGKCDQISEENVR